MHEHRKPDQEKQTFWTEDEALGEYRGMETAVAWISRIRLLVVGRSGHGFTEQHEARYPDIQSKKGRSQEKGQMANADTPTRGKWRGSHEGKCSCSKAGIQCDES